MFVPQRGSTNRRVIRTTIVKPRWGIGLGCRRGPRVRPGGPGRPWALEFNTFGVQPEGSQH